MNLQGQRAGPWVGWERVRGRPGPSAGWRRRGQGLVGSVGEVLGAEPPGVAGSAGAVGVGVGSAGADGAVSVASTAGSWASVVAGVDASGDVGPTVSGVTADSVVAGRGSPRGSSWSYEGRVPSDVPVTSAPLASCSPTRKATAKANTTPAVARMRRGVRTGEFCTLDDVEADAFCAFDRACRPCSFCQRSASRARVIEVV